MVLIHTNNCGNYHRFVAVTIIIAIIIPVPIPLPQSNQAADILGTYVPFGQAASIKRGPIVAFAQSL
jgi:hypothetical protein